MITVLPTARVIPSGSEGPRTRWLITQFTRDASTSIVRSLAVCAARDDSKGSLENNHCVSDAHEIFHARGVPVCEANTTVTCSPSYGLRIVRAVNADARF